MLACGRRADFDMLLYFVKLKFECEKEFNQWKKKQRLFDVNGNRKIVSTHQACS